MLMDHESSLETENYGRAHRNRALRPPELSPAATCLDRGDVYSPVGK
jgi:hypothetical protein